METNADTELSPKLSALVRRFRGEIIAEWESAVRRMHPAEDLPGRVLRDHMPQLVEAIAEVIGRSAEGATLPTFLPDTHALERLDEGFDLRSVATEFSLLRQAVIRVCARHGMTSVRTDELVALDRAIDDAVIASVSRYAAARERTLRALDNISAAALGTGDLDTFLPRLLTAMLDTDEAADAVLILLREGDALRVRAAAGISGSVSSLVVPVGGPFAGTVASERRPRLLTAHDDLRGCAEAEIIRENGLKSVYAVPLLKDGQVMGVAQIGSRTAADFSADDRQLFRAMAQRATSLIAQAQLVARERSARAQAEQTLALLRDQEERTRHSEAMLRTVLDTLPVGVWVADPAGRLTVSNPVARRVWGVPTAGEREVTEFHGRWADTGVPLDREDWAVSRALSKGETSLDEVIEIDGFDGQRRFVLNSAAPLRDEAERIIGAVVVNEDITEQREADQRRRILQEVSTALGDAVTVREVVQVVLDHAVTALGASRGLVALESEHGETFEIVGDAGYSPGELDGWRSMSLDIPMMFRDAVVRKKALYAQTREEYLRDYPGESPVGRGTGAMCAVPLVAQGEALGALGLSFSGPRTFTADERTFIELLATHCAQALLRGRLYDAEQRAHAEAQSVLSRLDALMRSAPVGLGFLDTGLRWVTVNPKLAALNGVSAEGHRGRTVSEVLPDIADQVVPRLQSVLDTGIANLDFEVTGDTAAAPGVERSWLTSHYPVRDAQGGMLGVGVVVVEITERKHAEEELRRSAEFRERFIAIVSHDLRNPLNAITMSAQLLANDDALADRHLRAVTRIQRSSERMGRMISDLLDFTRGRLGGGIPVSPKPTNLRQLVRGVVDELEASHPDHALTMAAEGNFEGDWDPDRLAQLLANLGKNALDYGAEGTPVELRLKDAGELVQIEVVNQGPPIPPELLGRIFEPFRRGDDSDQRPGSGLGLGLFIAREVVRAHGGEITVRSRAGEGTVFRIRLPRALRRPG